MTRKIVLRLCVSACLLVLFAGNSIAGIKESRHDFSFGQANQTTQFAGAFVSANSGNPIDEVCVFCHTPHHASSGAVSDSNLTSAFLWNRTNSTYNYAAYTSPTMTLVMDNPPKGITLMCMSCHDGVTTIQNIINAPGGGAGGTIDPTMDQIGDVFPSFLGGEGPNIGYNWSAPTSGVVDLSNDHPVSFTWVDGLPGIKPRSGWPANTVKLFTLGGNLRMECATCHDPHDTTNPPFLRMSNANSAMCTTCHDK